jgi:TRAP-type uncharacterized transport system fused permease subunit
VFTQYVVHLSQSYLLLALVFTMIAGIVLGMGMPTTPAYIIMTALLVPAIVKFGVVVPAAHMFAFYFAILSAITPPVALAVFAAAGIAKSNLWATGLAAVRIAATSFIVPFMFVYEPALLMIGDWPTIIWASMTAGTGVLLFAAGLHGYFIIHSAHWQSVLLAVAGLLLIVEFRDVISASLPPAHATQLRQAGHLPPEIAAESSASVLTNCAATAGSASAICARSAIARGCARAATTRPTGPASR